MGFDTSGYVLKSARSAPSNATSTAGADSGVLREHADLPGSYALPGNFVEVAADQYRAAVLYNPDTATQEYLFWAANSSNLAVLEDASWALDLGTGSIPTGTTPFTVGPTTYPDGTAHVVVTDDDDRSIASVLGLTVVRGDDPTNPVVLTSADFASQDADAGLVVLGASALTALGGGLSVARGDTISAVSYYLAAQKFWWTRNDSDLQRFGWDGTTQRWTPFKGSPPTSLGKVLEDESYALIPHPSRFSVGEYLPGDPLTPDAYAMVRLGTRPDATSTPMVVLVVTDDEAAATYSFPPGVDAVVGVASGVLQWNPLLVASAAGRVAWYVPETFSGDSDGVVGQLVDATDAPLFLAPIPGPTDYPLVRLGSRRYLTAVMADSDAALAALAISAGQVGWSLTTGKIKFNSADVQKADPDDAGFELLFLGCQVIYDGVSLTRIPVGTRAPVQVVDSTGTPTTVDGSKNLFIPASAPLPSPGTSGVLLVPDGTGVVPNLSVTPGTRSNGSGLIREISVAGDLILFGKAGAVETLEVVEFESDLPQFIFKLRKGKGMVARELSATGAGSRVEIGRKDRARLDGEPLYFLQAVVQPAVYANQARLVSRVREPYVIDGTEVLAFSVDGTDYLWAASGLGAGSFDAATVASSIDAAITGAGSATAVNGRIWISAADPNTGTVEVGFGSIVSGSFANRDLSGCAALGFLPGWRVSNPAASDNWLPDAGLALGVSRSPLNLDRSQDAADFKARGRFRDAVLSRSVPAVHVFLLNNPPLLDVAGYDDGIFFQTIDGLYRRSMVPFEDVLYEFDDDRFLWLEVGSVMRGVGTATSSLTLDATGVVGMTLHPSVGTGYGLYVDSGDGTLSLLSLGADYLLDESPGVVTLIDRVGAKVAVGSLGSFGAGSTTFTDADATFVTDGISAGYRLKLLGGDPSVQGSYIVSSVTNETTLEIVADVLFGVAGSVVSWEIYEGEPSSGYDPGLLADVVYKQFNHLPAETFFIRVLSVLGATPADAVAQASGRLNAVVVEALANGRAISVRFGQDFGNDEAVVTPVGRVRLGVMANGTLSVPDVTDTHFTTATPTFSILVGAVSYTIGTNLVGVTSFTDPLLGDQVEFGAVGSGIEGQLKFGEDTLANLGESFVYYVQTFTDPADLTQASAEVDPTSGDINLSAADMAAHAGETVYFVEQMITEGRKDVAISPIQGALAFRRPLREFQLVEASYYQADVSGNQVVDADGVATRITEFLPLFVRMEVATANTTLEYAFNPTGRTVRDDVPSMVWVDNRLQNYGNVVTAVVDADASVVRFAAPITSAAVVQINYAVNETFGGEQGFTVSTTPVWRPPFFLHAGENTFELESDRTVDFRSGNLLRIGPNPFYVGGSVYDGTSDTTTVVIFPTPEKEAGSRAPGNDVLTLLSSVPVTPVVNGNPAAGDVGFLLTLATTYEPVDEGMLSIVFRGDVTQFTVAGHLLDVGGFPFLSAGSTLSDDGLTTTVNVTTPFTRGFDPTTDVVKVSARPIYPPDARQFLGLGSVVETEDTELVLFGEIAEDGTALPGRTLVAGRDYTLDGATGNIALLAPVQAPLAPGQKLFFSYTRLQTLAPILQDGMIVLPRYRAGFAHVVTPTKENGFLDAYLVGTYTFTSPDSFYVRTVSMPDWMGEVAKVAADRVAARTPHGGPVVVSGPAQNNWQFGTVPLESIERELQDQDRAARVFLSLYDSFIRAFEQVNEAISGEVVGDRDGKFRFFVGRGAIYGGPGYEDQITGLLQSRFVWSQVFEAANQSFGVTEDDPVVDPETATQDPVTLVVSGDPMNPWLLDFYVREQRKYVLNDMDDTVLVRKRTQLKFLFDFQQVGIFYRMWQASVISRLYPEATLAFTTTYPGLLAGALPANPGVYAFLKLVQRPRLLKGQGPVFGSTFGMDIGAVENPALGLIENITGQVRPRARLARARIWAYSATGFPNIDPMTDGKPSVIATPLYLKDFPINQETGLPDVTQLTANGGGLADLSTGDVELSTPKWEAYSDADGVRPQVALGRPAGDTYSVGYGGLTLTNAFGGAFTFDPTYKGIFVGGVYQGCILTFTSGDGNEITNASDIIVIGEDGISTSEFAPVRGDTIYVIPPRSDDASAFANPPSLEDLEKLAQQQPYLDVGVRERQSTFVDRSLPSKNDPSPFPIKEILNQRTASPLQPIEADVEFVNAMRDPQEFPALQGLGTNDSGDHAIPYLTTTNTELDRLAAVQGTFTAITQTDSPLPNAVYPDEVVGNDGSILSTASGATPPATLLTAQDFTPVGVYTPHSGIGNVRRYDVLFVERGQAGTVNGMEGILSVGEVTPSTVEAPRFVTHTLVGTRIRYLFTNAMVHISSTGLSGVVVQENGGITTTFDIGTVGGLFLNDGSGAATGGLNNIIDNGLFAYPNGNQVTIDILDQGTGLVLETVVLDGANVTGGLGTVAMGAMPTFTDKVLTVTAIGFVDFAALGGAAPGPVGPFDFRITVDTFVAALTPNTGSDTAYVDDDRLTFVEAMDLRTVLPRGTVTVGAVSVQGELSVYTVTASGTDTCTVDHPNEVNGGDAFTFLARNSGAPEDIGTFDPSPGTGDGSVKVMAFEGANNTPIPSTGAFTFSAVPSSDQDEAGNILSGIGSVYDTGVVGFNPGAIVGVAPTLGTLSNVVPGDVVAVQTSSVGDATTKAGTYLVRYALEDDPPGSGYTETFMTASGGAGAGWVKSPFPTVVSAVAGSVTVSSIQTVGVSPSGYDWDTTGRLYLFVNPADITTTVSRTYTGFVVNGDNTVTFTLGVGTTLNSAGAPILDVDFDTAAVLATGKPVSGMVYLPIGQFPNPFPADNVVGHAHGITTVGGFSNVTFVSGAVTHTFTFGADLVDATGVWVPVADDLGVAVSDSSTTSDGAAFQTDHAVPVYFDVPLYVDLRGLAAGAVIYPTLHPTAVGVLCVAPGDSFRTDDGAATPGTGFHGVAGVFVEPSWARPTKDLGDGVPKVVDAATTAPTIEYVGMRSAGLFFVPSPEAISFTVRRIRRFHDVLDGLGENLAPLRFAYEIREGTVASYTAVTRLFVAAGTGTQLGGFDDLDVNINPGDEVRILDAGGAVVDRAEVAAVIDSVTLWLRSPGLAENPPSPGDSFQVYLRQAPVPHAQSNEQLIDLITDQVVFSSTADPVTGDGGRADVANFLKDPAVADFNTLGIQVGDIVLIDPAGALEGATGPASPVEYGMRPVGDQSVSSRVDGSHIGGGPSDLDDNRGWYRVVAVNTTDVEVSGVTDFTGSDGTPVILGATAPTNQQFAVYPDITLSGLTGTTEGQMDLRPTKPALPSNSYQDGSFKSIEPFTYTVIRPTNLVAEETIDLVLMTRERMLSFMEEMAAALQAQKQGSYYVFQRDLHDTDLGSATDGDDGLGVPSNVFITGLSGLTQYAPFANTSDCLSVLDRRYWVLDTRLDSEVPPYSVAGDTYASLETDKSVSGYTVGSGRPVGPDLVTEVLDQSDRLRALRYSWIKFRANQENGTLPSIDRFLADLPRLLQEQADFLRLQQSIKDSE